MIGVRSRIGVVVALVFSLWAGWASAAPTADERVLAEALFADAKALMNEKNWSEACPKLEQSYALEPLAGVLLNMAVCHEELGLTATAWSEFKEALALAKIDRRADREQLAREHIAALEPLLAKVQVLVPETVAVPGLVVRRDGTELPAAAWGSPVPVDPGEHVVEATAPGKMPFTFKVTALAGQTVVVEVKSLLDETPAPDPVVMPPAPAPVAPRPPPIPAPNLVVLEPTPWPSVGWSLVAAGGAGLLVGAAFGVSAVVHEDDASERCGEETCPDADSLASSDRAGSHALVSDVAIIAGSVVAAAGVAVLIFAPAEVEVSPTHARLRFRW